MSYMTISSQEKHNFSLCSCFHAHPTTLLLKILGVTNAWAVPHLKFWGGPSPPVSPRSPPLSVPQPDAIRYLTVLFDNKLNRNQNTSSVVKVYFFNLSIILQVKCCLTET